MLDVSFVKPALPRAGADVIEADSLRFDPERAALQARRTRRLGAIVLGDSPQTVPTGPAAAAALAAGIADLGIARLPWTPAIAQWRDRVAFLRLAEGEPWPDVSDAALAADGAVWLAPHVEGATSLAELGADRLDAAVTRARAAAPTPPSRAERDLVLALERAR